MQRIMERIPCGKITQYSGQMIFLSNIPTSVSTLHIALYVNQDSFFSHFLHVMGFLCSTKHSS